VSQEQLQENLRQIVMPVETVVGSLAARNNKQDDESGIASAAQITAFVDYPEA
jgi:hypothetical protein